MSLGTLVLSRMLSQLSALLLTAPLLRLLTLSITMLYSVKVHATHISVALQVMDVYRFCLQLIT